MQIINFETITTAAELAELYAQFRTHAETIGADWTTITRKGKAATSPKAPAAIAGARYTIVATMPDGSTVESEQRKPFAFAVAVFEGGYWAPKFYTSTEAVAKSRAHVARQRGAAKEHVQIVPAWVDGQAQIAPVLPQAEPVVATAPSVGREAEAMSKLDAALVAQIPTREALYAELARLEDEQAEQDFAQPQPDEYAEEYDQAAELAQLGEPVEEVTVQNMKIVGGTAVHAPDAAGFGTRCGIANREFVQTDADVTCKNCIKWIASA